MNNSKNALAFNRKSPEISELRNSLAFNLESATIIEEDDGFRLEVQQSKTSPLSKSYPTLTQARQDFLNRYGTLTNEGKPTIHPQWTEFFTPDTEPDLLILYIVNQDRIPK